MSDSVDAEFVGMSENLVRSLKHFASKLDEVLVRGDISDKAREKIRTQVMEGMSVYMMSTSILSKSSVPSAK